MVGFTKVFVTALLAVTATALPRPANEGKGNNGNEKGNNTGNGNGGSTELPVVDLGYAVHQGTLEVSAIACQGFRVDADWLRRPPTTSTTTLATFVLPIHQLEVLDLLRRKRFRL